MGGVRRYEHGRLCSQLCPGRFCTQEKASKQTLRPEFVCFVTLGYREKHGDGRSNAHRLESGVCGDRKCGAFKIRALRDQVG